MQVGRLFGRSLRERAQTVSKRTFAEAKSD